MVLIDSDRLVQTSFLSCLQPRWNHLIEVHGKTIIVLYRVTVISFRSTQLGRAPNVRSLIQVYTCTELRCAEELFLSSIFVSLFLSLCWTAVTFPSFSLLLSFIIPTSVVGFGQYLLLLRLNIGCHRLTYFPLAYNHRSRNFDAIQMFDETSLLPKPRHCLVWECHVVWRMDALPHSIT